MNMFVKSKSSILALLLLCITTTAESKSPSFGSNTRGDLAAMYNAIKENHPGPCNTEDRFFMTRMRIAYAKAYSRSFFVKNEANYERVLTDFAQSFDDDHLRIAFQNKKTNNGTSEPQHFICEEIDSYIAWISLPTFHNLTPEQKTEFDHIIKKLPELRSKHIIIDLRGNRGGNSEYTNEICDALYGKQHSEFVRCKLNKNVPVDWRISKGNIEHLKYCMTIIKNKFGLQQIINEMDDALLHKKNFYRNHRKQNTEGKGNPLFFGKVYTIINDQNGSAALNFLDQINAHEKAKHHHPKTFTTTITIPTFKEVFSFKNKHYLTTLPGSIGQTTRADTDYIEVRPIDLPSTLGKFWFPIKVFRNRLRKAYEHYIPEYPLDCDMNDDAKVKELVLEIVNGTNQKETRPARMDRMARERETREKEKQEKWDALPELEKTKIADSKKINQLGEIDPKKSEEFARYARYISGCPFFKQLIALPYIQEIRLYQAYKKDLGLVNLCPGATQAEWAAIENIIKTADTILEIDLLRLDTLVLDEKAQHILESFKVLYKK